jgi:hypothetical protein
MKYTLFVVALLAVSASAHAAVYMEYEGVKGETTKTAVQGTVEIQAVTTTNPPRETTTVSSGSDSEKKGNVEYTWKVEEGTKAATDEGEKGGTEDINIGVGELQESAGVEPDEIDFQGDSENATNFGILLGGGSGEDEAERAQGLERARLVLEENAKASDQAIESVSLNFEKITTRVRHEVRLFGFIPLETTADVDIDAEQRVAVRFPWWTIFASGDDEKLVAERVYSTISNVLKTKHDTVKNSIGNIR